MWSVVIILLALSGCSIEKVSAQKQDKIEYTILKEAEFPEKVQELIEENKTKEFQLTYQEQGNLYLIKGYGEQKTRSRRIFWQMQPPSSMAATVSGLSMFLFGRMPYMYRLC